MTQLGLPLSPQTPAAQVSVADPPAVDVPEIAYVRRRGARRYILRVLDDGTLRVTVPWWGSKRAAREFVESQRAWIARQRLKRESRRAARWGVGAEVLVNGETHRLVDGGDGRVWLAGAMVAESGRGERALRADVQAWLRSQAVATLPGELLALADRHAITVTRVSVRNQASRWGSCSRRGTISLNWRLVQTPPFVREYVLLHELMHRRELNHSARFWRHVARFEPAWRELDRELLQGWRRVPRWALG